MASQFLFVFGFIFIVTMLVLPLILGGHILEPKPKRDITIHPNIWPLTLPGECFDPVGKKIRRIGFRVMWASSLAFLSVIIIIAFIVLSE